MNRLLFSLKTCHKSGAHFSGKKRRLRQRTHKFRASKNPEPFFWKKKRRLRQRTHKFRASRNLGAIFLEKKRRLRQRSQPLRASKKNKIENSQNQNPFCPKCRQSFFKPKKKNSRPHLGPSRAIFCVGRKIQNFCLFSLVGPCCYPPKVGLLYLFPAALGERSSWILILLTRRQRHWH